ncbi:MAG: 23S rRNA (adenine(2503)-C(2))-methyltransferase RlmN [Desulfovibrio sp.]|nr:23S rRNA (adenine(2503)-C(2))-methyltransferase RlmN [Desulfovibrio sp.]
MNRVNLLDFSLPQLKDFFRDTLDEPPFRAVQVWQWIWQKLARDFGAMSNVSRKLAARLAEMAEIRYPEIARRQKGADGTEKLLLTFADGAQAETVLIPAVNRAGSLRWSQCLSTQIGCPMGCKFCATGKMGFARNMSMGEILGQVLIGKQILADTRPDRPVLRNLVFMGMGEPLLNGANLLAALRCLHEEQGANFSARRITVSTCGIEQGLQSLGASGLAYLAISLHAPSQELREQIMPAAASWPLDEMLAALMAYPLKTRERITFEYLLLGGVNDSPAHAHKLVKLLAPLRAKLNLIVYNPVPGLPYRAPTPAAVEAFQQVLWQTRLTAILRKSHGADIAAACGQLMTQSRPHCIQPHATASASGH